MKLHKVPACFSTYDGSVWEKVNSHTERAKNCRAIWTGDEAAKLKYSQPFQWAL
jgi:hypothetical protein